MIAAPKSLAIPCFSFRPNQPSNTVNSGIVLDTGNTSDAFPTDNAVNRIIVPTVANKEESIAIDNRLLLENNVLIVLFRSSNFVPKLIADKYIATKAYMKEFSTIG